MKNSCFDRDFSSNIRFFFFRNKIRVKTFFSEMFWLFSIYLSNYPVISSIAPLSCRYSPSFSDLLFLIQLFSWLPLGGWLIYFRSMTLSFLLLLSSLYCKCQPTNQYEKDWVKMECLSSVSSDEVQLNKVAVIELNDYKS